MSDPKRDRLKAAADLLHELAEEAATALRAYDHRQDPHLFPAPYLTLAAGQEARGEDHADREKAGHG